jgi:hypothetical protein
MKGGLKGVIDASFNVGSGIANRAGAMYESFKMGLTTNLFMRGLGLSRQQIYQDAHPTDEEEDHRIREEEDIDSSLAAMDDTNRLTRIRSNSDPARAFSSDFRYKNNQQASIKGNSITYIKCYTLFARSTETENVECDGKSGLLYTGRITRESLFECV